MIFASFWGNRLFVLRFGRLPAATAAQQIDRGAQLKQRIIGWLDSVNTGDGIEDNLLLFMRVVWDRIRENDLAEMDQGSLLGPVNRRVVSDIVIVRHLSQELKAYRATGDSFCELVKKEICSLALGCGVIQMVIPSVRRDPVASVAAHPLFVDEPHRGHTVVRFPCKAGWARLGRLHEFERLRMTTEEDFDRRWRWLGRIGRSNSSQEFQKLLAGSGRESVCRMANDIGMHMFSEIEPDGQSAGICVGISIWNQRKACGVRKPDGHWCGVAGDVRRPC